MDSIQRAQVSAPVYSTSAPAQAKEQETEQNQAPVGDSFDQGATTQEKPKAKWSILSYIAADCNLEEFQTRNVDNMELAPTDPKTNILVQIDRGPNPSDIDGGWTNCRRYEVLHDTQTDKLGSKVVEDMGRIDMSNPKTLADAIKWMVKNYPAEHYAVILNDHGGGFTGAMADDSDGKFMSVPQNAAGFAEAQAETGVKIDIIGYDACLMAETEVANELAPYGNILLASEESEGGPGWTYSPMLGGKNLTEALDTMRLMKLDATPEQFAKIVVDVNRKHNRDIPTFSAIDLTKMPVVNVATDGLADAIIASPDKTAIKNAIRSSESYGSGYTPYKDLHDQYDMAEKMLKSTSINDPAIKKAAQTVIDAVNEAVIDNENNPQSHPNSHGMSIYAPTTVGTSGPGYGYNNLQFAKETKWGKALASLGGKEEEGMVRLDPNKMPDVWPDGSPRKA